MNAAARSSDTIALSWAAVPPAADPECGIGGYAVYMNGERIGTTHSTAFTASGLTESTSCTFHVAALNGEWLEGPRSTPVPGSTKPDTKAPEIVSAVASGHPRWIKVTFSEPVDSSSAANIGSYSVSGGLRIESAQAASDRQSVRLTTADDMADVRQYTLIVNGAKDLARAPNTIASQSSLTFTYQGLAPGLYYQYHTSDPMSAIPAIEQALPVKEGVTPSITLSIRDRDDSFALRFAGAILVDRAGEYTFTTRSDDGSMLYIDGMTVVNNSGSHAPREQSGRVILDEGLHTFTVTYFEANGGQELSVLWECPGITRSAIPDDHLYNGGPPAPTRAALVEPNAPPEATFALRGLHFSSRPGGRTTVGFVAPNGEGVTVALYDLRGRKIAEALSRPTLARYSSTPVRQATLPVRALDAGHYICLLSTPRRKTSARVLVPSNQ